MQVSEDQRWEENTKNLKLYMNDPERKNEIAQLIGLGKTRLPINLNKIRELNSELAADIIKFPNQSLRILQPELQEVAKSIDAEFGENDKKGQSRLPSLSIAFEGDLGRNFVTPRGLLAKLSNQLVSVQGIVTKMSTVKNKIIKSVHYCKVNETGVVREYDNQYNLSAQPNLSAPRSIPTKDKDGNPIIMEDGRSQFIDSQTFVLQELPENAPAGLLPRSIEVVMEEDLVDTVKPGDRIEVIGVFKSIATQGTTFSGRLKSILIATNSKKMNQEQQDADITPEDIKHIKEQGQQQDIIQRLTNSVAPSIYGHDLIKQGILLQLVGGIEKNVEGMHLRGDINILMIGDPSTAKSQMLRYVMNTAPLALNTTGRGSSGVGLTAVVKSDRETGQRSLEAGAMVLADRGIVCIDELDKMDQADRVAIHEAMEQQTVTISKAGIHCSLNARCSVIAAANPVYGEYHTDLPPTRNINLPDSLLSRFDLLFIVLDEKDTEKDRRVADRVTRNHSYKGKNSGGEEKLFNRDMIDVEDQDYVIQPQGAQANQNKGIYQKMHKYYSQSSQKQLYSQEFIQKYLKFCKKINSELTDESIDYLSKKWKDLRQRDQENQEIKVLPITIRTYETMIRLSTAFAKLRQSRQVQIEDCKNAYNLLRRSLFGDDEDDYSDDDDDYHPSQDKKKAGKSQSQKKGFQKFTRNKMDIEEEPEKQKADDDDFKLSTAQKKSIKKQQEELEKQQKKQLSQQKQQQQQQSQKEKELKKKQPIIVQEMKKIRIDDEEEKEVDKILAEQEIASIKVTKEERTQVFKCIGQLLKNTGIDFVSSNDIWKKISPIFGANNKDKLVKCLVELDLDGKIDYQEEDDQIYLL